MRKRKNRFPAMYAIIAAVAIVISGTIGGSLAWLVDSTQTVENTFTVGNIDIKLEETGATDTDTDGEVDSNSYKMVPGNVISKDPKVTVEAGSEACWLFVKITPSDNCSDYLIYSAASEWDKYTEGGDIYYQEVAESSNEQSFYILAGNEGNPNGIVTVSSDVTKKMMDDIEAGTDTQPTLTFQAVAIQQANRTLEEAYTEALNYFK